MKISRYKYAGALLVLLIPFLVAAASRKEFTKNIDKEFVIAKDGTLAVSNKYGNIEIRTWNEARVKFEITIKADVRNQDAADDIFKRITVSFDNSAGFVRAKTEIETITGWKSWLGIGSNSDDFEINYIVFAPSTLVLELENKYGDIFVPDMSNRASIDLRYGNLKAGNLPEDTHVSLAYSDGSIQSTGDVELDIAYADLNLGSAGRITLDGKYSDLVVGTAGDLSASTSYVDVKIDKMGKLSYSGKYDDFVIGDIGSFDADTKYSSFDINQLRQYADMQMSYGSMNIDHVSPGFISIDINTSYTDVTIHVDEAAAFVLDVTTKYCDVEHHGVEISQDIEKSDEKTVKGYRGTRDASAHITASMSYGGLKIR